mgnify:CR=1 FL=1
MDNSLVLTLDMALVLALLALTVVLFVREWVSVDVAALTILVVLGLTQLVPTEGLFAGFASSAVMAILAVMVLGAGLDRAGVMSHAAGWVLRLSGGDERRLILALSILAGSLSAFMQNPAVAALFLPVASRIAARTGYPLSDLLLPMGFCIVLGGTMSMVGNSPMILLNDLLIAANRNLPPGAETLRQLGLFSVLPVGLGLFLIGLAYLRWWLPRLLPRPSERESVTPRTTESYFEQTYGIRGSVMQLQVDSASPVIGMAVQDLEALPGAPLVLALKDGDGVRVAPPGDHLLAAGTLIGVLGPEVEVRIFADAHALGVDDSPGVFGEAFDAAHSGISEAVLPPSSRFIGKSVGELRLRKRYGMSPLAIHRGEEVFREDIRQIVLRSGDCIVFHSAWRELAEHAQDRDFVIVTDYPKDEQRPHKQWHALTFFALGFVLALIGHVPLPVALWAGAAGMLLSGVISMDEAYKAISWKTIFLLACLIPLGAAVDATGTAAWIAQEALGLMDGWPIWALQLVMAAAAAIAAMVISQVGATVLMVPMAINLALAAQANPVDFALIAALGASNNFVTSSNPVNLLISGPGNYRPEDFWRAGLPLTLIFVVASVVLVNLAF